MSKLINHNDVMHFFSVIFEETKANGFFNSEKVRKLTGGPQLMCIAKTLPIIASAYVNIEGLDSPRIRCMWANLDIAPAAADGRLLLSTYKAKMQANNQRRQLLRVEAHRLNGEQQPEQSLWEQSEHDYKRQIRIGAQLDRIENTLNALLKEWRNP